MLHDLEGTGPEQSVHAATPIFGSAVYRLNAVRNSVYGATIYLTVYGSGS